MQEDKTEACSTPARRKITPAIIGLAWPSKQVDRLRSTQASNYLT